MKAVCHSVFPKCSHLSETGSRTLPDSSCTAVNPDSSVNSQVVHHDRFEEGYAKHLKQRSQRDKWRFGAVGAGIGGLIGLAAAPVAAVPLALVAGGVGGSHLAKKKRRRDMVVSENGDAVCMNATRPTLHRLKYLVKWGTLELMEQEDDLAKHIFIVDEVVRAFSPWVQQLYLLRAKGQVRKEDPEMGEVLTHLVPLYMFFQHRAVVDVTLLAADAVAHNIKNNTLDGICWTRARVVFPTIVEAVCVVDRLSPPVDADALAPMRTRRVRLQRLVDRIREILDEPGAEVTMQTSQVCAKLEVHLLNFLPMV